MYTTINEYNNGQLNDNKLYAIGMIVPPRNEWEYENTHGHEKLGISLYGNTYWIMEKDLEKFENNIGNWVRFRYTKASYNIIMPVFKEINK